MFDLFGKKPTIPPQPNNLLPVEVLNIPSFVNIRYFEEGELKNTPRIITLGYKTEIVNSGVVLRNDSIDDKNSPLCLIIYHQIEGISGGESDSDKYLCGFISIPNENIQEVFDSLENVLSQKEEKLSELGIIKVIDSKSGEETYTISSFALVDAQQMVEDFKKISDRAGARKAKDLNKRLAQNTLPEKFIFWEIKTITLDKTEKVHIVLTLEDAAKFVNLMKEMKLAEG